MSEISPKISILMAVFNAEQYLQDAIQSILNQSIKDWEFLIIDDASTDISWQILNSFEDSRIRLFKNENNLGLTKNLNYLIKRAKGEYIARMDADDISLPTRLAKQYAYMKLHPEVDICGTAVSYFNDIKTISRQVLPTHPQQIRVEYLFHNAMVHATLMIHSRNKTQLEYPTKFKYAQDYALFSELSLHLTCSNLPEVLYCIRTHPNSISTKRKLDQKNTVYQSYQYLLKKYFLLNPHQKDLDIHYQFTHGSQQIDIYYIKNINSWMKQLWEINQRKQNYPEPEFTDFLKEIWIKHTLGYSYLGLELWKVWKNSPFSEGILTNFQKLKFWLKCLCKI